MGVYKCNFVSSDYIEIGIDIECEGNEIYFKLHTSDNEKNVYLNFDNCEKLANELKQLLTEGKGNE